MKKPEKSWYTINDVVKRWVALKWDCDVSDVWHFVESGKLLTSIRLYNPDVEVWCIPDVERCQLGNFYPGQSDAEIATELAAIKKMEEEGCYFHGIDGIYYLREQLTIRPAIFRENMPLLDIGEDTRRTLYRADQYWGRLCPEEFLIIGSYTISSNDIVISHGDLLKFEEQQATSSITQSDKKGGLQHAVEKYLNQNVDGNWEGFRSFIDEKINLSKQKVLFGKTKYRDYFKKTDKNGITLQGAKQGKTTADPDYNRFTVTAIKAVIRKEKKERLENSSRSCP